MKTEPTEALRAMANDLKYNTGLVQSNIQLLIEESFISGVKYGQSSPKVKQLEWIRYNRYGRKISETPIGNFYMDIPEIGKIRVDLMEAFCGYFDSVDEAKRQAQNIFERRIKECLDL